MAFRLHAGRRQQGIHPGDDIARFNFQQHRGDIILAAGVIRFVDEYVAQIVQPRPRLRRQRRQQEDMLQVVIIDHLPDTITA